VPRQASRARFGNAAASSSALARLEIGGDELARALDPEVRARIAQQILAVGYRHVTIDLRVSNGSLNEGLRLTLSEPESTAKKFVAFVALH
jgi:PP-loop superfamily ATP-utilizing enzyme